MITKYLNGRCEVSMGDMMEDLMEGMDIQFIGVNDLDEDEKLVADRMAKRAYSRIARAIKNEVKLVVHIKVSEAHPSKTEKERLLKHRRYSVKLRVVAPTRTVEVEEAGWQLQPVMRHLFKEAERHILKVFRQA